MTPTQAVRYVNARFKYREDKDKFRFSDIWRVMSEKDFEGDCEDYALTVLWLMTGRKPLKMFWWLLTRKARIISYKHVTNGSTHAGLKYEGMYVDNISGHWNENYLATIGYKRRFSWPVFLVILEMMFALPFIAFKK